MSETGQKRTGRRGKLAARLLVADERLFGGLAAVMLPNASPR